MDDLIASLEGEYDRDHGFIGQLRYGHFDREALDRLLTELSSCEAFNDAAVPGALARLLWMMPWVVEWQTQRLEQAGQPTAEISNAGNAIFSELERIFGVP